MKSHGNLWWAVVLLLMGCASAPTLRQENPRTADLRGMVYDLDRLPVPGVRVEADPGTGAAATTDVHGRFLVPDVVRGPVVLRFSKDGWEPFVWTFEFSDVSQIVYVQLSNVSQIYEAVAVALERREWQTAEAGLERAGKLQPPGAEATFLEAMLRLGQGRPEEAARLLEAWSGSHAPVLAFELELADLYENALASPQQAVPHLKKALQIQGDVAVSARLKRLEGAQP